MSAPLWYVRLAVLSNVAGCAVAGMPGLYLCSGGTVRAIRPADAGPLALCRTYTEGAADDVYAPIAAAIAWFTTGDIHFLTEAGVL